MKGDRDKLRAEQFQRLSDNVKRAERTLKGVGVELSLRTLEVSKDRKISCPGRVVISMCAPPEMQTLSKQMDSLRLNVRQGNTQRLLSLKDQELFGELLMKMTKLRWEQITTWTGPVMDAFEDEGVRHVKILTSSESVYTGKQLHLKVPEYDDRLMFIWEVIVMDISAPPLRPIRSIVDAADVVLKLMEERGSASEAMIFERLQRECSSNTERTLRRYVLGDIAPGELEGHLWVLVNPTVGIDARRWRAVHTARSLVNSWLKSYGVRFDEEG